MNAVGQGFDRRGFRQSRQAFHQQMTAGQKTDKQAVEQVLLADDDAFKVGAQLLQGDDVVHGRPAQKVKTLSHSMSQSASSGMVEVSAPMK